MVKSIGGDITVKIVNWSLDADILNYLFETIEPGYFSRPDPQPELSMERLAILRLFLYTQTVVATPTVRGQIEAFSQTKKGKQVENLLNVLLPEVGWNLDPTLVRGRADELNAIHRSANPKRNEGCYKDCEILAEAESCDLRGVLTNDRSFLNRLSSKTTLLMKRPSELWVAINLPKGVAPVQSPRYDNPLIAYQSQWVW